MKFNENKGRKGADFNQLDYFDSTPFGTGDESLLKSYAAGNRDYARFESGKEFGAVPNNMHPIGQHPMMNFGASLWETITGALPSVSDLKKQAEEAAKKAAADLAAKTAQQILDKPQVQQAITEQAQAAAVQTTATKVNTLVNWLKANPTKAALYAGIPLLGIAYLILRKR